MQELRLEELQRDSSGLASQLRAWRSTASIANTLLERAAVGDASTANTASWLQSGELGVVLADCGLTASILSDPPADSARSVRIALDESASAFASIALQPARIDECSQEVLEAVSTSVRSAVLLERAQRRGLEKASRKALVLKKKAHSSKSALWQCEHDQEELRALSVRQALALQALADRNADIKQFASEWLRAFCGTARDFAALPALQWSEESAVWPGLLLGRFITYPIMQSAMHSPQPPIPRWDA